MQTLLTKTAYAVNAGKFVSIYIEKQFTQSCVSAFIDWYA